MNSISSNTSTKTHIYIGPAALTPPLADDDELIVVTGDKSKWSRKLIERRSCLEKEELDKVKIKINTIGKPGAQKKWYSFNHPFLNGTLSDELISWCNEGLSLETLETNEIECTKIDDIVKGIDNDAKILLSIAQGDPLLTIKRSKKILPRIDAIDISLHPLSLIWEKEIEKYLLEVDFGTATNDQLIWKRREIDNQVDPLANPPESKLFLSDYLQVLLESVQLEDIREDYPEWSSLYLMRQIAIGNISAEKKISIIKTARKRLSNFYKSKVKREKNCTQGLKTAPEIGSNYQQTEADSIPEVMSSEPQLQVLKGHIDGFDQSLDLRGWVDASDFGSGPSTIQVVWREQEEVIGQAIADLDRPDLIAAGINNGTGFSINIKTLDTYSLIKVLDQKISLDLIESKSGHKIGNESWILNNSIKIEILSLILDKHLNNSKSKEIENYLNHASNIEVLTATRNYLIAYSALQCQIGNWNCLPFMHALSNLNNNPLLNYGADSESAYRLELVLAGLICLTRYFDQENIHGDKLSKEADAFNNILEINTLSNKLTETCYAGLQDWELKVWSQRIRPLFNTLIATLMLQETSLEMGKAIPLLDSLAKVAQSVYTSPGLCFQLRSLVNLSAYPLFELNDIELDLKRQDRFSVLVKTYSNQLKNKSDYKNIEYFSAAIDFTSNCPAIFEQLTNLFDRYLSQHLRENSRKSISKHWVDRLGHLANGMTQNLVRDLIDYKVTRKEIIRVHTEMIDIKKKLAEMLFKYNKDAESVNVGVGKKENKKWLIIGEKNLAQCWIYRVEQKKQHLEKLGCEVRCIDWQDLRFWSFTNDILWCDSLVVCRLPAFFSVFRAIAFARHNSKKVYAEIDDLIFTDEYPAEYESYGGTISHRQHDNLSIDYILRKEVMNYADEVIVSTKVLAEKCNKNLNDSHKQIHILPNLPLEDLNHIAENYKQISEGKSHTKGINIVLTSGTLSHKQILNQTIFPILNQVLAEYPETTLSTIGHIKLPTCFNQYQERIISIPFTDYPSYLDALSQGDLALVPLERHATTDGKSAIKWMEASYCGVPCICSPVRAYTDVTEDQTDVFIAESSHQWKQSIIKLIKKPNLRRELALQAFESAKRQFNDTIGVEFWDEIIRQNETKALSKSKTKKVLLINVYFAPQSIGGATRVAQDYVQEMLDDPETNYEVTVLCTEYDHWQSNHGQKRPPKQRSEEAIPFKIIQATEQQASELSNYTSDLQTLKEINKEIDDEVINYNEQISLDISYWRGARVVRLNISGKPWSCHEDKTIAAFCTDFFAKEKFDEIQCHCCQIITASPLVVAQKMNIPYDIVMHDAWWMSPEQFLVSKSGNVIDPSDPYGHFDLEPNEDEIKEALERRELLFDILKNARQRIAVSKTFAEVCQEAGIENVSFKENKVTSMTNSLTRNKVFEPPYNVCHIGGMSLHKGFQLLRSAVDLLPQGIPLVFTIVDHRLTKSSEEYISEWNGYQVKFIAPIAMSKMSDFYASQDILVAPSIWPESFGLVTREAISAGLWVIASDSGALAEPLKVNPSKGTIINPNDIQDLANALKELPNQLQEG